MGKGVLNVETAGQKPGQSQGTAPAYGGQDKGPWSSVTVMEKVSLEPLERIFNDDLGLGRL